MNTLVEAASSTDRLQDDGELFEMDWSFNGPLERKEI